MSTTREQLRRLKPRTPKAMGLTVMVGLLLFALFAFNRPRVETMLSRGDTIKAEFSQSYKLVPYQSIVKEAGVEVGTVTGVERTSANHAIVKMKLKKGTRDKLGTQPAANVRPSLILGGTYYVELVKGGKDGTAASNLTIPLARTTVPVELDKVLSTITPDASKAVRGTVESLNTTLKHGGSKQVQRFLATAPDTLDPATDVLNGARGTNPETDLSGLVTGLQHTARALSKQDGQLGSILDNLATTSATLADTRAPISQAVADGPETLDVTKSGLADLNGTLDRLNTTSKAFRPSARALNGLLTDLGPVLKDARPVIADARVVARDARPLVETLVPTAKDATGMLNDVKGPVITRLNGPVKKAVLTPWHGTGVYNGGGNDHKLYEETGYLLSDFADVFKFHDHNGAMGRLMAGVGLSTVDGIVGMSLEEYLEKAGMQLPKGPQQGANDNEPKPPLGSAPVPGSSDGDGVSGLLSGLLPLLTRSN